MLRLPFFDELAEAKNVLLAGAGGGFDIFSGLPLYFALQAAGKTVHLANLSFSLLPPQVQEPGQRLAPTLLQVTAETPQLNFYFPERYLAEWFRDQGAETPIYCFERTGVQPLHAAYEVLAERLSLDTVILIDGGTDSLMRGDEAGLGTPEEDIASIMAVDALQVARKLLVCLGFGVDHFHGVCHAHFLEAVAELSRGGGYLGMFSLLPQMPEVQQYRAACEAVFARMPQQVSIVTSSILSAIAGAYGNHHTTSRTAGNELWINPLMSAYWCFRLAPVASRILYREVLMETRTFTDVRRAIERFREWFPDLRPRQPIPL
jgi:hypothetical protein